MNNQNDTTIQPGLYSINWRAASLKECFRAGGFWKFPKALIWKLISKKVTYAWLPPREAAEECPFEQLDSATREKLDFYVKAAKSIGYDNGRFSKLTKSCGLLVRNCGDYMALHKDKKRIIVIAYLSFLDADHHCDISRTVISIGFYMEDLSSVTVSNFRPIFDNIGSDRTVYMPYSGLAEIEERIQKELARSNRKVMSFESLKQAGPIMNRVSDMIWLERIQRGLAQKASPQEEERIIQYGLEF